MRRFSALFAVLTLAGCATGGDFPSLAPRPVEQLSFEEPIRVDPPVAPDPALRSRFTALLAAARAGDAAFDTAYARALPAVRAAGPSGSDSWVEAQQAISRVEAAGKETSRAVADLNQLVLDQADEPTNEAEHQALLAARDSAVAIAERQRERVDELRRRVSR